MNRNSAGLPRLSIREKAGLLIPYVRKRIGEQIKAVALIVVYLAAFQTVVLGIPIPQAVVVATGISVVVLGLMFFMEGLFLGLMPLGESIGVALPQKARLPLILLFAAILGYSVTRAEPAIGVLQQAGMSVKAWDAPLLFLLLNKYSAILVHAVGAGVGVAVLLGMLRFVYNWSLKPFLYVLVGILSVVTIAAYFNPNLNYLLGLAWDCGAVTTGPVTVPLVLALGIGICRVVSKSTGEAAGFGVVTLASLLPIIMVMILGILLLGRVPSPDSQERFFSPEHRQKVLGLFAGSDDMRGYAIRHGNSGAQTAVFDRDTAAMHAFVERLKSEDVLRNLVFGAAGIESLNRWAVESGSSEQRLWVFGSAVAVRRAMARYSTAQAPVMQPLDIFKRNAKSALQAILPLVLFLLLVLFVFLREKLPRPDEIVLGVIFGIAGMTLFNIGIELGLSRLGSGVGSTLPALFKKIDIAGDRRVLTDFHPELVSEAIGPKGNREKFFTARLDGEYQAIPYDPASYDSINHQYIYTPSRGPIYGAKNGFLGLAVVFLFAFLMGYGATLAEPALNALGLTVEEITVGTFKKTYLMQAVAVGVGLGMMLGLFKIIFNLPLAFMLVPPYLLLLLLSRLSSEEYVNIGWDSAGVTTGPITVPLVLAMGLGIGGKVNVVEGFGILAMSSVMPILAVLCMGLFLNWRARKLAGSEITGG